MGKHDRLDPFGVTEIDKEVYAKKLEYVLKNCKCTGCPTYVAGDAPVGYCFPLRGTSNKTKKEVDCICKTCSIYKEYELNHSFYCTRCSESCQMDKSESSDAQ